MLGDHELPKSFGEGPLDAHMLNEGDHVIIPGAFSSEPWAGITCALRDLNQSCTRWQPADSASTAASCGRRPTLIPKARGVPYMAMSSPIVEPAGQDSRRLGP